MRLDTVRDEPMRFGRITVNTDERAELLARGEALHQGTGHLLRLDRKTGRVTVHHRRTGEQLDYRVPEVRR